MLTKITERKLWLDWIDNEFHHNTCCISGFAGHYPNSSYVIKRLAGESISIDEEDEVINLMKYNFRGIYLINNILNNTVPTIDYYAGNFDHTQLIQMNDWKGLGMYLSVCEYNDHDEKEKQVGVMLPESSTGLAVTDDIDNVTHYVLIDGNHRARDHIRTKKSMNLNIILIPQGSLIDACQHIKTYERISKN